ncbi:MAG: hypothetical protein AAF513_11255 [Pseudomonadota bacterium]
MTTPRSCPGKRYWGRRGDLFTARGAFNNLQAGDAVPSTWLTGTATGTAIGTADQLDIFCFEAWGGDVATGPPAVHRPTVRTWSITRTERCAFAALGQEAKGAQI